jgi:hypothetical protein
MGVEGEKTDVKIWKKQHQLSEGSAKLFCGRTELLEGALERYSRASLESTFRLNEREIEIVDREAMIAVKLATRHKKGDHDLTDWELGQLNKIRKLENGLKQVQLVQMSMYKDMVKLKNAVEETVELELDRILELDVPEQRTMTDSNAISQGTYSVPTNDEPDDGDNP